MTFPPISSVLQCRLCTLSETVC